MLAHMHNLWVKIGTITGVKFWRVLLNKKDTKAYKFLIIYYKRNSCLL